MVNRPKYLPAGNKTLSPIRYKQLWRQEHSYKYEGNFETKGVSKDLKKKRETGKNLKIKIKMKLYFSFTIIFMGKI